ncbi:hypothetical protein PMIN06_000961 [Paraphaeosphaeria minitans]
MTVLPDAIRSLEAFNLTVGRSKQGTAKSKWITRQARAILSQNQTTLHIGMGHEPMDPCAHKSLGFGLDFGIKNYFPDDALGNSLSNCQLQMTRTATQRHAMVNDWGLLITEFI